MGLEIREVIDDQEREECFKIRRKIFVESMGLFFQSDIDEYDFNRKTIHIIAKFEGRAVGTVRIIDEGNGIFRGSRLSVLPSAPPLTGFKLVRYAVKKVEEVGGRVFRAFVLPELDGFFRRCGWVPAGETIYAGRRHIIMIAKMKRFSEINL